MLYHLIYKMNNSFNNSDVDLDLDINSIFNPNSSPNSPFLAVSQFFTTQFNLNKPRTPQQDLTRFQTRALQLADIGGVGDARRFGEQVRAERVHIPAYSTWWAPTVEMKEETREQNGDLNNQIPRFIQAQGQTRNQLPGKSLLNVTGELRAITANALAMVRPEVKQDAINSVMKENVEHRDEDRYNLTTVYLRKFNILSKILASQDTAKNNALEPLHAYPLSKKIRKPTSKTESPGGRSKTSDKRAKRRVSCNCKNSSCVKMYCECFRESNSCRPHCKCKDCKNIHNNDVQTRVPAAIRRQSNEMSTRIDRDRTSSELSTKSQLFRCRRPQCQEGHCNCRNNRLYCKSSYRRAKCSNNITR